MLRAFFLLTISALLVASVAGRFADRLSASTVTPSRAASSSEAKQSGQSGPRVAYVSADRQGHFTVNALVEGRHLEMMVDTGASTIALTKRDAERLGVSPGPKDWTAFVSTANGVVRAAPVQLRRVEIAGMHLNDVRALVLPAGALGKNLLGLSFLSRLKRYEFSGHRLILEQ